MAGGIYQNLMLEDEIRFYLSEFLRIRHEEILSLFPG